MKKKRSKTREKRKWTGIGYQRVIRIWEQLIKYF